MSGDGDEDVSKQETKHYFRLADQNSDMTLDFNEVFEFDLFYGGNNETLERIPYDIGEIEFQLA